MELLRPTPRRVTSSSSSISLNIDSELRYRRSPSPIPLPLSPPPSIHLPISPSDARSSNPNRPVPVPWRQLIPLLLFSVCDAMTYAVIFPLISDMVTSFGVPSDKIGLYAGLGEGVMMLVEALAAPIWARLADTYGRRWALIVGFSVCAFACPMVGFSGAVWQIVLWRACLGLNSGGVVTKIMAAELSHPSNRAQIFSILSPAFSIGMVMGTFLGGELAHPFNRLPTFLGGSSEFLHQHPYALPCLLVGALDAITVFIGIFSLVETRHPSPQSSTSHSEKSKPRNQFRTALKVPGFVLIIAVSLLFQISTFSWDGMYTVYTYTKPSLGGLGLSVDTIGLLYSVNYLVSFAMNPIFLPRMQKKWGSTLALGIVLAMWPTLSLLIPLTQWTAVHARWGMWIVIFVQLSMRAVGAFGWAMCDILTMTCFDDYPDLMATGSAISLISGAGGRAFGPAISGWSFSISTQYPTGSFLRQISWLYMVVVTIPAVLLVRFIPRDGARPSKEEYEVVPMLEAGRKDEDDCETDKMKMNGTSV